jgi:hypothetical protein
VVAAGAVGLGLGDGDGLIVGLGLGDGDGLVVGLGLADGLVVGLGLGEGTSVGDGDGLGLGDGWHDVIVPEAEAVPVSPWEFVHDTLTVTTSPFSGEMGKETVWVEPLHVTEWLVPSMVTVADCPGSSGNSPNVTSTESQSMVILTEFACAAVAAPRTNPVAISSTAAVLVVFGLMPPPLQCRPQVACHDTSIDRGGVRHSYHVQWGVWLPQIAVFVRLPRSVVTQGEQVAGRPLQGADLDGATLLDAQFD